MKPATILLLLFLFSCGPQSTKTGNDNTSDNGTSNQPVEKKFDDPARVHTCEVFLEHVKKNDLSGALSMIKLEYCEDDELAHRVLQNHKSSIIDVIDIVSKYKVAPKDAWIVKYDTSHFKVRNGPGFTSCMSILEYIFIPIDRGPEPEEAHKYLFIVFNITDLDPPTDLIGAATIAPRSFLDFQSNHIAKGF